MHYCRYVLLFMTLALIASGPASADVLLIDGIQSAPVIQTPRNGLSMAQVRQQFGEPAQEVPAVGEPPISRWEYTDSSHYFSRVLMIYGFSPLSQADEFLFHKYCSRMIVLCSAFTQGHPWQSNPVVPAAFLEQL